MLSRVYIDNFRCFVNFEHRPLKKEVIFGGNGTGKSSFIDALLFVRQFAVTGIQVDDYFLARNRTRWSTLDEVTFELEARLGTDNYRYRLVVEPWSDQAKIRVAKEEVYLGDQPIFEFIQGEIHLYNDRFEHKVTYDFDWQRSGLATILPRKDNQNLTRFKQWFSSLYCFRINPYAMTSRSESEHLYPTVDLTNIPSWYRNLVQDDPVRNSAMLDRLSSVMEGFKTLKLESFGENVRMLAAEFTNGRSKPSKYYFDELSDGQRALICLYVILHFVIAREGTVVIDEPENFVSLPEIQPWLDAVTDTVEEENGQIILVSHHPETINQWAPSTGFQFTRKGTGPVAADVFQGLSDSPLSAAEIVARGWGK